MNFIFLSGGHLFTGDFWTDIIKGAIFGLGIGLIISYRYKKNKKNKKE
jgi:hypothetical protein